jgi:hypothetical protein
VATGQGLHCLLGHQALEVDRAPAAALRSEAGQGHVAHLAGAAGGAAVHPAAEVDGQPQAAGDPEQRKAVGTARRPRARSATATTLTSFSIWTGTCSSASSAARRPGTGPGRHVLGVPEDVPGVVVHAGRGDHQVSDPSERHLGRPRSCPYDGGHLRDRVGRPAGVHGPSARPWTWPERSATPARALPGETSTPIA